VTWERLALEKDKIMPFMEFDTFTVITTIFWVWMMADCLFNKRVRLGWFFIILFTHFVGAIIYYFIACSHRNPVDALAYYIQRLTGTTSPKKKTKPTTYKPPYYQPQRPVQSYNSTPYEQGYQAQSYQPPAQTVPPPASMYEPEPPQEEYNPQAEYEQPTTTYPEMPPQQMH
jgi:hypothetical protein